MRYSVTELASIKAKIFAKIAKEIEMANRNNEMDYLLDKYGVSLEVERMPIYIRTTKILVVGGLSGSVSDYQKCAKKLDIDPNNVDFLDYYDFKKFSAESLRYSSKYSDIIFGPVPHKSKDMGDVESLLHAIKNNEAAFPKLTISTANSTSNQLKFSISSFRECLLKTYYYEILSQQL